MVAAGTDRPHVEEVGVEGLVAAATADHIRGLGTTIKTVVVDLGYRGVDAMNPGVEIIHRGRYKSLTPLQWRWLKRRQAIEPAIGHTKADHRLDRCWL